MKEVLKDKRVSYSLWAHLLDECTTRIEEAKNDILEQLDIKMTTVEEKNKAQDERLDAQEKWANNIEQDLKHDHNNQIIITAS